MTRKLCFNLTPFRLNTRKHHVPSPRQHHLSVTSTNSQQHQWLIYMSRAAQGDCGRMSFSPEGSGLSASEAGEPPQRPWRYQEAPEEMFPSQTLSGKHTLIWVACQTRCMKLTSWTWEYETRPTLMWHSSGQWSVRAAARVTSDQRPYCVTHAISG